MLKIFKGDCLEVMAGLPDKSVDCFICDLPYGCLQQPKNSIGHIKAEKNGGQMNGCAWDIKLDLDALWTQIKRLAKDEHTPILMFCTTKFGYELIKSNERWFRYDLVWDKGRGVSFLSANKMPMRSHEMIYVFSKAGARYERVDISGNFAQSSGGRDSGKTVSRQYGATGIETHNKGKRCVVSVIPGFSSGSRGGHPTEKPQALYDWLIRRYCPSGGTILDPTAGSFNSCFAAVAAGRKAIGIEKDAAFFEKARLRAEGAGLLEAVNEITGAEADE